MDQFEKLNVPLHLSSPGVPIPGRLSTLSVNPISRELSHLPYRDLPIEYSDTGVRSQSIEQIPFDRGQIQNTVPANTDQGRAIDQSVPPSSVHGWAQAIAPGPLFPHVTPAPPGSQFDSSSISSSLPGHPAQVFGRNQGPNFQPGVSSVSAPFGFDTGSSLHPTSAFPMDANEAFNLSERPKKAAVPNWLRDEIIKKKSTVASSSHDHPNGDSSHSTVAEVHDKIFRKDELADSKSLDSTRSTEDEDDDEDDVDAVRSAAINQEIKRVLTDVLLKVTDELFEEIATKVLNEDELEVDHSTVVVKRKDSLSPPPSVTPKTSAKVMVPAASTAGKSGPVGHSTLASSGGDILGLANYASDDDYEENQGSSAPFSGKSHDSSDQCGARGVTSEDTLRQEKPSVQVAVEEPRGAPLEVESANKNSSGCNGALTDKSRLEVAHTENAVKSLESGSALERKVLAREKLDRESESAHGHSDNGNSNIGQVTESISKSGSGDVPQDRKGPLDRNFSKGVESVSARRKGIGEDSDAGNLKKRVDRDQMLEKIDERASSKPRSKDLSSKHSADLSESESRRTVYHGNDVDDKKGSGRDKKDRMKEVDHWKRERIRDEKEGRSRQATKDSYSRQKSRQTSSPSARCRNGGDNSLESPSSGSGEETSETSKKRYNMVFWIL
uniref:Uncharacterized protein n=1 Tax=Anthurium amnicola TaxID=1678845 RepID=A0A1D1YCM0_9ARAE